MCRRTRRATPVGGSGWGTVTSVFLRASPAGGEVRPPSSGSCSEGEPTRAESAGKAYGGTTGSCRTQRPWACRTIPAISRGPAGLPPPVPDGRPPRLPRATGNPPPTAALEAAGGTTAWARSYVSQRDRYEGFFRQIVEEGIRQGSSAPRMCACRAGPFSVCATGSRSGVGRGAFTAEEIAVHFAAFAVRGLLRGFLPADLPGGEARRDGSTS